MVQQPNVDNLILSARRSSMQRDFVSANRLAEQVLHCQPANEEALMIAAVAAAERQQFESAVAYCQRVPAESGRLFHDAQCMAGNLLLSRLNRVGDAEQAFRRALTADENSMTALERLAYLLSLQTRTTELSQIQLRLLKLGQISATQLSCLIQPELLYPAPRVLSELRASNLDHAGLMLAESRAAQLRNAFEEARQWASNAIAADPELSEAHVRLGQILLASGSTTELQQWHLGLPDNAYQYAETWVTLGHMALNSGQQNVATRCFCKAGQCDATSLSANYMLGQQLAVLDRPEDAATFLKRARLLEEYRNLFDHSGQAVGSTRLTTEVLRRAAALANTLELEWEEHLLAQLALRKTPPPQWASDIAQRIQHRLPALPLQRTTAADYVFERLNLDGFPWPSDKTFRTNQAQAAVLEHSHPRFDDVAEQVGLEFQFNNGANPDISGAQRPFDFTGGGLAVLDIDGDNWPDLYCSQGCRLDKTATIAVSGEADQLFRNLRGQKFTNVSPAGLPQDLDYSQGVTAGDFNNDGFADVFVANLGLNRLLRNNGDGTFTDVSSLIESDSAQWTTSCVIADLNGDALPDLYSVNYLGSDIHSRICQDETGRQNSCAPQDFAAAQDQIHINEGTGRFLDTTHTSGIVQANGKGLGIVVADFNGDQRPDLFVANDGMPNFLFEASGGSHGSIFHEVAMERGVAVNKHGLSEACMGIVVEDLDQDQRLDIFVSNFLSQSNTLYNGFATTGYFQDNTQQSGLALPSIDMLGFGIQSIDAELDGQMDLFVANGHVDDFRDRGVAYQMPPQLFRNQGSLQFEQIEATSTGDYFKDSYLGRAVAKLDWNKDGLEDVVVGHLDRPLALLQNETVEPGYSVAFQFRSTRSARDAIGTVVDLRCGNLSSRRQLTAGDGYQASNERKLIFGVGRRRNSIDAKVSWGSGHKNSMTSVKPSQEFFLIDSRDIAYRIPK